MTPYQFDFDKKKQSEEGQKSIDNKTAELFRAFNDKIRADMESNKYKPHSPS